MKIVLTILIYLSLLISLAMRFEIAGLHLLAGLWLVGSMLLVIGVLSITVLVFAGMRIASVRRVIGRDRSLAIAALLHTLFWIYLIMIATLI